MVRPHGRPFYSDFISIFNDSGQSILNLLSRKYQLDKQGCFFCRIDNLQESTCLSGKQQTKELKNLNEKHRIFIPDRGKKRSRYLKIDIQNAINLDFWRAEELNQKNYTDALKNKHTTNKSSECVFTHSLQSNIDINFNNLEKCLNSREEYSEWEYTFIKETFEYYWVKYKRVVGWQHPRLKLSQIRELINRLRIILRDILEDVDELNDVIDEHFKTRYTQDVDYNIFHFVTLGVIQTNIYKCKRNHDDIE